MSTGGEPGEMPDSVSIIGGAPDGEPQPMHYFDSRGVKRLFMTAFEGSTWKIWRAPAEDWKGPDGPGFNQRFIGEISADGKTIEGRWERASGIPAISGKSTSRSITSASSAYQHAMLGKMATGVRPAWAIHRQEGSQIPSDTEAARRYLRRGNLAEALFPGGPGPALIAGDVALTHDELRTAADGAARRLHQTGVRQGTHVALFAENSAAWIVSYLGLQRLGATLVGT